MKLVAVSDTHGNYPAAVRAVTAESPDVIVHLGDLWDDAVILEAATGIRVVRVAGNCDQVPGAPRKLVEELGGIRFLLSHGDRYSVKAGLGRLREEASSTGVSAVLFGHTHHPLSETISGILYANPGTLAESATIRTYAAITISGRNVVAEIRIAPPL